MSNANGIIYIDTSSTPNIGVSIYDIQSVLGMASYNDIGGLIVNGGVKKWAKYKPVVFGSIGTTDQLDIDKTWKPTATWWKATDGFCGFSIENYANIGELIGTEDTWEYVRPNGTLATQPFRFFDFNRYNHNAVRPFNLQLPPSIQTGGSGTSLCGLILLSVLPEGNLLLTDIGNFADMYFGIVVVRGQQAYIKTLLVTLDEMDGTKISLQGCPLVETAGTATLYAVLTTHAQSSWTNVHEYPCWSLNCEENYGISEMAIIEPNADYYGIVLTGLSNNDRRAWRSKGRPLTATLSSGSVFASDVQESNMSTSYTLDSVSWVVAKNSDPNNPISQGSVPVAVGDTEPGSLEAIVETPGSSTNFSALYNVGTLPPIDRSVDYYRITYTFHYTPDY